MIQTVLPEDFPKSLIPPFFVAPFGPSSNMRVFHLTATRFPGHSDWDMSVCATVGHGHSVAKAFADNCEFLPNCEHVLIHWRANAKPDVTHYVPGARA